jgi:hypothetical protein
MSLFHSSKVFNSPASYSFFFISILFSCKVVNFLERGAMFFRNQQIFAIAFPADPYELRGVTHTGRLVDFQLFNSWRMVLPSPGYVTTQLHRSSGE